MVLVGLPIGGLAAAGTIAQTVIPTGEEQATMNMGTADVEYFGLSEPARRAALDRLLPPGFAAADIYTRYERPAIAGAVVDFQVDEPSVSVERPPLRGMYVLVGGRLPSAPGEAALHPDLIRAFCTRIGRTATVAGHRVAVVGTVIHGASLRGRVAVFAAGTMTPRERSDADRRILVDLPAGYDIDANRAALEAAGSLQTRDQLRESIGRDRITLQAVAFAAAVLALFGTGLIASAAFVVGARRQLRAVGLLGAVGAQPSHIRAAVLFGGTTLGLVGSVVGVALGTGIAAAITPLLGRLIDRGVVGPLDVSFPITAGAVALGSLAATAAAYTPARWASRISAVAALQGRPPAPRPAGSWARRGLVLAGLGLLFVGRGAAARSGKELAVGLVVALTGFLLAIPIVVTGIGRMAAVLPAAARIAARETSRHGRRTAAAVAAGTLALALPVAVGAMTLGEERVETRLVPFDTHQMQVGILSDDVGPPTPAEVIAAFRQAFPGAAVARLTRAAVADGPAEGMFADLTGATTQISGPGGARGESTFTGALYVGDAALLRALGRPEGIDPLRDGLVVAAGDDSTVNGTVTLVLPPEAAGDPREGRRLKAFRARTPATSGDALPRYVISEEAAATLGLQRAVGGELLIRTARPIDGRDIERARAVAARFNLTVFSADRTGDSLRAAANAGGIGIALIIVAVSVALVGAESRRDFAILSAVGASPRTRRSIAAARAGLLTLSAAVLAVPAGFLPIAVAQMTRSVPRPIVIPWNAVALVVLATPAIASIAAGLVSRRPSAAAMLRPIT